MIDELQRFYQKYRNKGLLIDTNILIFWVVGTVNLKRLEKFNRTKGFTAHDYDLLLQVLDNFSKVITTPHILTEVSNLINNLGEPERSTALKILGQITQNPAKVQEEYRESSQLMQNDKFSKFGLTDCGILEICQGRYLVLTNDLELASYLYSQNIDTINFNHIRGLLN
ncbi:PIN domain-containing protein [Roseofilum sp. Guam]|uniref:PIN domain-containing protein n=1 Tax=Roseofilum sp. Guam TaxID=2821502 RepID=UPI001B2A4F1E|nr:PIN domain-containing protein [Roseofilum sp. Guam]MBP0030598.1 hypothetical protein [Roseofilum sp. Guam]